MAGGYGKDIQRGVALALEGRRRGLLSDEALGLIFSYYDNEGATDPMPAGQVLVRLGGLTPTELAELMGLEESDDPDAKPFNDRLTLLDKLGEGAMGAVFRGYDKVLRRVVAIKLIRTSLNDAEARTQRQRFQREATAMARVRHPACVGIHDVGISPQGEPYLVMEFVAGRSLDKVMADGPLEPRVVAAWGQTLSAGLQACHDVGLIHRDVKPANVLIDEGGQAQLTDFGVVRDHQADIKLTAERVAVGTLHYIPPEQAIGKPADARSDVYSLGATLYHVLTGSTLFSGETALELLRKIDKETPPAPRALRRAIPLDLDRIVVKAVSKDPQLRYATADALALDLQRFLAGEPVEASPPGALGRLRRRLARNKAVALTLLLCLALLAVTVALLAREGMALLQRQKALNAGLASSLRVDELLQFQTQPALDDAEAERAQVEETLASARREADVLAALALESPDVPELALLEGEAWRSVGEFTRALACAERARRLDPDGGRGWLLEARVCAARLRRLLATPDVPARLAEERKRVQDCFAEARRRGEHLDPVDAAWEALAADERPRALEVLSTLSTTHDVACLRALLALLEQDGADTSAAHLEQALAARPRSPQALYLRGVLRARRLGDRRGALADFDRVLAFTPTHGFALCERASARLDAGDTSGAAADIDAAIQLLPDAARPHEVRSQLRAVEGDLPGARQDVDLALSRNPDSVLAYRNRGRIKELEGDAPGALADYEAALRLDPAFVEGYLSRGLLHHGQREHRKALEDFDRALRLRPTSAALFNHRGRAKLALKQHNAAIKDFTRALQLDPGFALAQYHCGLARANQGDPQGAIEDYTAALEIDRRLAPALLNRGLARRALDETQAARADFDAALAIDPNYGAAYFYRAQLWAKEKNEKAAARDYEQVLRIHPEHGQASAMRDYVAEALGRPSRY